jgi:hypothetical protein
MKPVETIACRAIYRHLEWWAHLDIGPGLIRCTITWVPGRGRAYAEIEHRARDVVLVSSRLLPPPFRWGLDLTEENGRRVFVRPYFGWRRIRAQLHASGFVIDDRRAWIYQGGIIWRPKRW